MSETLLDRGSGGDGDDASPRRPTVAVVLAAGRSLRLISVTDGGSKALVRVGGLSLVERAVRSLLAEDLERVVRRRLPGGGRCGARRSDAPERVTSVRAGGWERGNGVSLAAAEPFVAGEHGFVLITTDHVFEDGALRPLIARGRPAVLVDHTPEPGAWAEGTRVRLHSERVIELSKDLEAPSIDCGAFLLPIQVFDAHRRARARGDDSLAGAVTSSPRRHLSSPGWRGRRCRRRGQSRLLGLTYAPVVQRLGAPARALSCPLERRGSRPSTSKAATTATAGDFSRLGMRPPLGNRPS